VGTVKRGKAKETTRVVTTYKNGRGDRALLSVPPGGGQHCTFPKEKYYYESTRGVDGVMLFIKEESSVVVCQKREPVPRRWGGKRRIRLRRVMTPTNRNLYGKGGGRLMRGSSGEVQAENGGQGTDIPPRKCGSV